MNRYSIVVITYRSAGHIGPCLEACLRYCPDVLVIDNASGDGTAGQARSVAGVKVVENAYNRGFAGAVNQAFGLTGAEAVLLLNPDAVLLSDPAPLAAELEGERIGIAAGCLLDGQQRPQDGFTVRAFPGAAALAFEVLGLNRLWPSNPVNRRYRCHAFSYGETSDVEQPAGAFLVIRRQVWRELGGFDESFHPAWFEDVDFCRRAAMAGWRIRYVPSARARHTGGHSFVTVNECSRLLCWYSGVLRYAAKHFRPAPFRALCAALLAGSILRMLRSAVADWTLRSVPAYRQVAAWAIRCLLRGPGGIASVLEGLSEDRPVCGRPHAIADNSCSGN